MELEDRLPVGWVPREAGVRDYVLAGVVAFGGAGPEEEAVLEGLEVLSALEGLEGGTWCMHTD